MAAPAPPVKPSVQPHLVQIGTAPAGLDKSSWAKFRDGRQRAARTLDLHGLTATRAHYAVTHFLERAFADQIRVVEIITGKGEVLARELPHWLNGILVRRLILAVAHPHAANTGSVRILLRRMR
jgi:DNA-nicking Smr family endonuclease